MATTCRQKSGKSLMPAGVALVCAFAFLLFSPGISGAALLPITGNETTVSLTSYDFLTDAGFDIAPLGDATVDAEVSPPEITFPITGGTVDTDTGAALIEHDNSGFSLAKNSGTASFENFLIDTNEYLLSGMATVGGTTVDDFPLFDIDADTLALYLTPQAASALDDEFEVGDLTGTEIGVASVDLATGEAPVPEPATILLLGSGMFGLAFYGRKRRGTTSGS